MALSSRHIVFSVIASFVVGGLVIACGSDESKFGDGSGPSGVFSDASLSTVDGSADDPYANDPPPQYCGPAGTTAPPAITGTAACPDDKNKPGCSCPSIGATAACWTGLRSDRNLGVCKDGQTTCQKVSETSYVWGECKGEVLPTIGAKGKEACSCFSVGTWNIANTSPCYSNAAPNGPYTAYSTVPNDPSQCPVTPAPAQGASRPDWSTDDLTVDCAGTFNLIFRIRAGSFEHPSANDCILGESALNDVVYNTANEKQVLPPLPAWVGKDQACATKWGQTAADASPGYGEMIVKGKSVTCDAIDDGAGNEYVFHRVKYCPSMCSTDAHKNDDVCLKCATDSSGDFTQK